MTKLAENNPQGTANIADDRVLAPVFSPMLIKSIIELIKNIPEYRRKFGTYQSTETLQAEIVKLCLIDIMKRKEKPYLDGELYFMLQEFLVQ
jgi:hypothetical protein